MRHAMAAALSGILATSVAFGAVCTDTPSWLQDALHGYDITTWDPINPNSQQASQGVIMHISCDLGLKWTDPNSGIVYDWPDQFDQPLPVPGSLTKVATFAASTAEGLAESLWAQGSSSACAGFACGSASASFHQMFSAMFNQSMAVSIASITLSSYSVNLAIPPIQGYFNMSETASMFYNRTIGAAPSPLFAPATKAAYDEFGSAFGTHFPSSLLLGCRLSSICQTSSAAASEHSEEDIQVQAGIALGNVVVNAGGGGKASQHAAWWTASTTCETVTVGPAMGSSIMDWQKACWANPNERALALAPISLLLPNSSKAVGMASYIQDHEDRAVLNNVAVPTVAAIADKGFNVELRNDPECRSSLPQCRSGCTSAGCIHDGTCGQLPCVTNQHPVNITLYEDVAANAAAANGTAASLIGQAGILQLGIPVNHEQLVGDFLPHMALFVANTTFSNRTEVGTASTISYQKNCGDSPTDKIRVIENDYTCGSLSAPAALW